MIARDHVGAALDEDVEGRTAMYAVILMHPSRAAVALLSASLTLTLAPGCRREAAETSVVEGPVAVRAEAAVTGVLKPVLTVAAVVQPSPGADWTVVAPEAARIVELPKNVGDPVKEGDVLARFENPALSAELIARQSDVAHATARAQTARAAATRLAGLLERGIAPQRDLDDAQRELAEAEAALNLAKGAREASDQAATRMTIRARFAGVIAERWHQPGDAVAGGTADPVLRVIDPARLEVVAQVPVGDLLAVSPGRPARIFNPVNASIAPSQVISRNAPAEGAATADVRIALPAGVALAAGTALQVDIDGDERANAVLVSRGAILKDGAETYVMVAGSDGRAHRRVVMTGLSADGKVHVVTGVLAGEFVILPGPEPVADGAAITIEK